MIRSYFKMSNFLKVNGNIMIFSYFPETNKKFTQGFQPRGKLVCPFLHSIYSSNFVFYEAKDANILYLLIMLFQIIIKFLVNSAN